MNKIYQLLNPYRILPFIGIIISFILIGFILPITYKYITLTTYVIGWVVSVYILAVSVVSIVVFHYFKPVTKPPTNTQPHPVSNPETSYTVANYKQNSITITTSNKDEY